MPPKEDNQDQPSISVIKRNKHIAQLWPFIAALAAVVIILLVWFIAHRTSSPGVAPNTRLLYANSQKGELSVDNTSGKQLFKISYPNTAYLAYAASGPDGRVMVSLDAAGGSGGYILAKNGEKASLNTNTIKALQSSVVLTNSPNMFFADNNTLIYVSCQPTCQLMKLDISTGKTSVVKDTGAKGTLPPPAYILGLSINKNEAYVHIIGSNSLSKSTNSIYIIDLSSGKLVKEVQLSPDAGYGVALSPDRNSYAYIVGGYTTNLELHVKDINSSKETITPWGKNVLDDTPATLVWSPDSQKVLFGTAHISLPNGGNYTKLAYWDSGTKKVKTLTTVNDQSKNLVSYWGWLDDNTVAYEQDTTTTANDFSNPTKTIYKQGLGSTTPSKIDSGVTLLQIYRY